MSDLVASKVQFPRVQVVECLLFVLDQVVRIVKRRGLSRFLLDINFLPVLVL